MSVIVHFAMFPVGKGESLSEDVAHSLDIIDKSGLPYKLGSMGTEIEGNTWDEVIGVVQQCYDRMTQDCSRVYGNMTIAYRQGRKDGLTGKVASVEQKLGRELKK